MLQWKIEFLFPTGELLFFAENENAKIVAC